MSFWLTPTYTNLIVTLQTTKTTQNLSLNLTIFFKTVHLQQIHKVKQGYLNSM